MIRRKSNQAPARTQADPAQRPVLIAAGLAALGLTLALAWPMLWSKVYVWGDLEAYYLPTRAFFNQALHNGDNFLWWPNIQTGFYLHGEGQTAMTHPLHLLLHWALPLTAAYNLELLLTYPLGLWGAYLFLRRLELDKVSALFGAFGFAFGAYNLLHLAHLNVTPIVAHLPWLLLCLDTALSAPSRGRAIQAGVGLALLTGSQLLNGHPQFVYLTGLIELSYLIVKRPGWAHWSRPGLFVGAKLVGLALAGVQLAPSLALLTHTDRATMTWQYIAKYSIHPEYLFQLVSPYIFRRSYDYVEFHEYSIYLGAVGLLLNLWLIRRWFELNRTARLICLWGWLTAGFGLWLALGKYGYLLQYWLKLPLMDLFRTPARHALLFQFGLTVTAALGLADLIGLINRGGRLAWSELKILALPCLAGLALTAALFGQIAWKGHAFPPFTNGRLNPLGYVLIGPALFALAAWLIAWAAAGADKNRRRAAVCGLILLAAADLGVFGLTYSYVDPPETIAAFKARHPGPPDKTGPGYRIHTPANPNPLTMSGWRAVTGYSGVHPPTKLGYGPEALRLRGTGWIETKAGWQRAANPASRAWLVSRVKVSSNPARDIKSIDPAKTGLTEAPIDLGGGPPGRVWLKEDRPGLIKLHAFSPTRQLLVLGETYNPGWRAEIKGVPAAPIPVFGDFLGLVVPAGRSDVTFIFSPEDFRLGLNISLVSLIGCLILLGLGWSWNRRQGNLQ